MHTAFRCVDVICKGDNDLVIAVGVLQGHLCHGVVLLPGHVDDAVVDRRLVLVNELDKGADAAFIAHLLTLLPAGPLVLHNDGETCVEKCLLLHPLMKDLVVIDGVLEHLGVRLKGDDGAGLVGLAHHGHVLGDMAPGKLHLVYFPVLVHLDGQPFGQGVYHACAHAVKAAGDLIAAAAELAAGVEDGKDHLQSGLAGLGLNVHRDASAVIGDGDDVSVPDGHFNPIAVARQSLVNGVVHNLIHQMMETGGGGGADVHARTLPDGFQTLQHLYFRCVVVVFSGDRCAFFQ